MYQGGYGALPLHGELCSAMNIGYPSFDEKTQKNLVHALLSMACLHWEHWTVFWPKRFSLGAVPPLSNIVWAER